MDETSSDRDGCQQEDFYREDQFYGFLQWFNIRYFSLVISFIKPIEIMK